LWSVDIQYWGLGYDRAQVDLRVPGSPLSMVNRASMFPTLRIVGTVKPHVIVEVFDDLHLLFENPFIETLLATEIRWDSSFICKTVLAEISD
jgi:hypothetical protein